MRPNIQPAFNEALAAVVKLMAVNPNSEREHFERILNHHCPIPSLKRRRVSHLLEGERELNDLGARIIALETHVAIMETAAARVGVIANQVNLFHQRAVNALLEMSLIILYAADLEPIAPHHQVPALFRLAIDVHKAQVTTRGEDRYQEEFAILEVAHTLLEQAKDENPTPEQIEFYSSLTWECVGDQIFRVKYAPENTVVN
jgi:hypothetical protein